MMRVIWVTFLRIFLAVASFALFGISFAAFTKSQSAIVVRNGFSQDYFLLSVVTAVIGLFAAGVTILAVIRALRPKAPPPVSHF